MEKKRLTPPLQEKIKKNVRMHLLTFLFLLVLLPGMAVTHAQSKISVDIRKENLKNVFTIIQAQSKYRFLYSSGDVNHITVSRVKMENAEVSEVLHSLLQGTGLIYEVKDDIVFIKKATTLTQQQKTTLTGQVKDASGQPLPGVSVIIKGTSIGVSTDADGKFKLDIASTEGIFLVFSFIGMENAEVKVDPAQTVYQVTMQEAQTTLDDVVVTGFFTKNKNSFTGSVKTLTVEELKTVSNTNLISALAMLTPGLKIVENNQAGSNPNRLPEIVIRGTSSLTTEADVNPNQPIIILDGLEITLRDLYDLDINEIERVDVLKDASASALYGEKAANGVIVIERKKILHEKLRLTYNLDGSVDFPDLTTYDYLNAADKLEFERRANLYDFENKYDLEEYNRKKLLISKGVNTNWMSKPLRTGYTIGNSVGISGKGNNMTYRVNANIRNVKGVMKDDYRNTYGVSLFLAYHVADKLTVSYQSNYSSVKSQDSPYGTFSSYVSLNPYDTPYDESGTLLKKLPWDVNNPLYEAKAGNFNKTSANTFTNTVNIRWDILKGLYFTANGSIVSDHSDQEIFISPASASYLTEEELSKKGLLTENHQKSLNFSGNFVVSYNKHIGSNNLLSLYLGGDIYKDDARSQSFLATGFLKPGLHSPQYAITYQEDAHPNGSQKLTTRAGFFANLNFILQNKYFVDGAIRRSGSSQFGANNRYAPFWSVGAGWNIHNESFIQREWLNTLRLRYSYGVTGNITFPSYQAITTYTYSQDHYYLHGMGAIPKQMGNKDLTWQTTKTNNIGLNADLFHNRLSMTFDYYVKTTDDLLIDQTIPPSIGESKVKNNLGKQRNRGFEFDIAAVLLQTGDWRFSLKLNGAHNKNKILAISNALAASNDAANRSNSVSPKTLYKEGQSTTAIYAVRSAGINPANGKEVFMNKDGEYTLTYNTDDKVVCGDENPKLEGSVFPMLYYKNWSLNISMTYKFGGQIYNSTRSANVENVDPRYNVDQRAYDERWKGVNDLFPYLDIADTESRSNYHSSRFVEDENTLQINRIELAYEFKSSWLNKIGFKRLRMGAGMNDVVRFSSVKYERGTSYPFSRGFSFTISPTF